MELTVVICAYNCEKYIEETLSCIINQTYQDFNLLIIDDCSEDNGVKHIHSYLTQNKREYELVGFTENRGIGYARYFAERHAKTKYMVFVDSDDLPYPQLIEKLYNKIISDASLMAVGCYLEYIDSDGEKIGGGLYLGETTKEGFFEKAKKNKLIFMQPTAIFDREVSLSVGGFNIEGFPTGKPRYQDLCEDLDLWTRMSDLYAQGKAIVVVPEVLCKYRKHDKGLSSNSLGMILRMKHVKSNLLKRRAGESELTFIEYLESLSTDDMKKLRKKSISAEALRNGAALLKKGKILAAIKNLSVSVWNDPKYIYQKIKHNSGLFK